MFSILQVNRIFLVCSIVLLLAFSSMIFYFFSKEEVIVASYSPGSFPTILPKKFDTLSGPAFSLEDQDPLFEVHNLEQILEAKVYPVRPTKVGGDFIMGLTLKPLRKEKILSSNQKMYLNADAGNRLSFSRVRTPFWVIPRTIQKDRIDLEVGIDMTDVVGFDPSITENRLITLKPNEKEPLKSSELQKKPTLQVFSQISMLVPDQVDVLLKPSEKPLYRLRLGDSFLQVSEGDLIALVDSCWSKISLEEVQDAYPLIRVKMITDERITLEGWEKGQVHGFQLVIPKQTSVPLIFNSKDFLSQVRVKTHNQISCQLEKQPLTIKVGDWVLKSQGKWEVLSTKQQIEDYLGYRTQGILFVLQNLTNSQGKKVLSGTVFDSLRTQKIDVEVAVERKTASTKSSLNTSVKPSQVKAGDS